MTNDEAIKTLREDYCGNRIICELYPDQCNREDCEIWLAIKALETQPDGDAVSRKDAIRIVDSIDTWQAGWRGNAIESLKALPSTQPEVAKDTNVPINDTISRQAAIDLVKDVCEAILSMCGSHYDGEDEVYDDLLEVDAILKCNKEIRVALKHMPPVQPMRKKGKWIYNSPVTMKCDQCEFVIKDWDWNRFNFCPNCDADMRGGQDE